MRIKVIKRDNFRKVDGEWEHVPFSEQYKTVDIVEAKNRTEVFNRYVEILGKGWDLNRNSLIATRTEYLKKKKVRAVHI